MVPAGTESDLEQACRRISQTHGCLLLKIQGARGYPDRLLLRPNGTSTFIEFKRPGHSLRALQKHVLSVLRSKHFQVEEVDNKDLFLRVLLQQHGSPPNTKNEVSNG
jgi:VRR-NUC domain